MTVVATLCTLPIRAYQWILRPVLGSNCRFLPSCSDYAIEALRTHGAMQGAALAGRRILRCNPWVAGGFDPVPPCEGCAAVSRAPLACASPPCGPHRTAA